MNERGRILEEAGRVINGERQDQYGNPENNFSIIAKYWSLYTGVNITELDVCMMMTLLKLARIESGTQTKDSFVDMIGYTALGWEVTTNDEF